MTFIPDLNVLLAYTAAAIILVITPGPDMTLFLGQPLTGGRPRGIAAGICGSAIRRRMVGPAPSFKPPFFGANARCGVAACQRGPGGPICLPPDNRRRGRLTRRVQNQAT